MTRAIPFTQAKVTRAIAAAQKAGLRVIGIKPDGTVLVQEGDAPIAAQAPQEQNARASRWSEVKA
jgi:hypothetical protein